MEIDLSNLSQFHKGLPEQNIKFIKLHDPIKRAESNKNKQQAQATASSALFLTAIVKFSVSFSLS